MKVARYKWISVIAAAVLLLTLALPWRGCSGDMRVFDDTSQLKGLMLTGVSVKSPDNAVKVFLDTYFGVDFGAYESEGTFDEAVARLRRREASAIWAVDLTAEYLCRDGGFASLAPGETPGGGNTRFSFGFAFSTDSENERVQADEWLSKAAADGTISAVRERWMADAGATLPAFSGEGEPFYIGVTGAVPPLEIVSPDGSVGGMAAELAGRYAESIGRRPVFVALESETALVRLMAGKVDMLAAYGTSENHSMEIPQYRMSSGYAEVKEYRLVVNATEVDGMVSFLSIVKDNLISGGAYSLILRAIAVTAVITLCAWILAMALGALLAYGAASKRRAVSAVVRGVAFLLRSTPVLLAMLLLDYGIFGAVHISSTVLAAIAVGLFGAGSIAELLTERAENVSVESAERKASVESAEANTSTENAAAKVPAEQEESDALGNAAGQESFLGFVTKTVPSRLISAIGEWKRLMIGLLQWTTVAGYIGANDLTEVMQGIGNRTLFPVFSIAFSIVLYLVAVLIVEWAFSVFERKKTNP